MLSLPFPPPGRRRGLALLVASGHAALLWAVTQGGMEGALREPAATVVRAALLIHLDPGNREPVPKPDLQPRILPPMNIESAAPPELAFEEMPHTVAMRQRPAAISVPSAAPGAHRLHGAPHQLHAVVPVEEPPRADADYLDNPRPLYPVLSRRLREEGLVLLRVLVNELGLPEVVELEAGSGFSRLDLAACAAVRRWRFVPARRGGTVVSAWVNVPIVFDLGEYR